jgi:hypothetical protein
MWKRPFTLHSEDHFQLPSEHDALVKLDWFR